MADCITFTKTLKKNDFKDGDILWTQSYTFDAPNSHEIQGAIKLENDKWKICIVLASDREDKNLVWPAILNWKLCVVKKRKSKLWGSTDGMTLTNENIAKCNWTDSIEVLHVELERDEMTESDGSVTFMWYAELNMPVYSSSCISEIMEDTSTETVDVEQKESFVTSGNVTLPRINLAGHQATHVTELYQSSKTYQILKIAPNRTIIDWTTTLMADCITFTKTLKKSDFKDGDIFWTQSYTFDAPNSHEIQGAVKLENDKWKICVVLASDSDDKTLEWPAILNWRLCVVKKRKSKLWGSRDGVTLTNENIAKCNWTDSIEVLHVELERDEMTESDGSVTFMWYAELNMPVYSSSCISPTMEETSTETEDVEQKESFETLGASSQWISDSTTTAVADCITFTKTVNKEDFKDGDILWTQTYTFEAPYAHEVQGVVKRENNSWKMCLVLASDCEKKELIWPIQLSWKLCVVKNRKSKLLGIQDGVALTQEDVGKCNWTDSIEVFHGDLEGDWMSDDDGSVTFMWFTEMTLPLSSDSSISQNVKYKSTVPLTIVETDASKLHVWTTTVMADCITFTKTLKKNDFKDGDILWTQSYTFDAPNSHEIQGAVKLENDKWKICVVLASDSDDKTLVWPAILNWRLCVVKKRKSKLWGSRDGVTLTNENIAKCNWKDSIEVLHVEVERDEMTESDGSVTFMWYAELNMPVYSSSCISPTMEEASTETEDVEQKESFETLDCSTTAVADCITFIKTVNKDDFKDGDILWTQTYTFEAPYAHEVQGVVKRENNSWKICLVLASDCEKKELIWPIQLSWKLCVVKNRKSKLLGIQDGVALTQEDVGKCNWTDSIEVFHSTLEGDWMSDDDGSVTFMWFTEVTLPLSSDSSISQNVKYKSTVPLTIVETDASKSHDWTTTVMADCITFTKTLKKNDFKDGDVLWTQSYTFDSPNSHEIQGAVKLENDKWKICVVLASDSDDKTLVWPAILNWRLCVVKKRKSKLWGSREGVTLTNENIAKCNWTDSIEVLHDEVERDEMTESDGSLTFMWYAELNMPVYSSSCISPTMEETSTETEDVEQKESFETHVDLLRTTTLEPLLTPERQDMTMTRTTSSSEEPVIDQTPSTSRETPETMMASQDVLFDMRSSEEGYNEGYATFRQTSTSKNKRPIDVLLIGKTGNGKSSVGNSILFREEFETNDDKTSCTQETQFAYSEFDDVTFTVVDGPGIGDTKLDETDARKLVLEAMSDAIIMNAEGYHAILFVVSYVGNFTKEDVMTLKTLKDIFGDSFIKDHAILVMTYGDYFYRKAKKSKETFDQWCKRQEGVFKQLLSEVENRIVLFDNDTEDNSTRHQQVQELIGVIDGLSSRGKRYTNEIFEGAKDLRDQHLGGSKQPIIDISISREIEIIMKKYSNINFDNVEEAYESLKSLLKRTQKLIECIKEQDRNTGVLDRIILAEDLKIFIQNDIDCIHNIIDFQETDRLKRDWQKEDKGSYPEKEKEEEGKESKWKSKEKSKQIEDAQKEEEVQEDHKSTRQMEVPKYKQEKNTDNEAWRGKQTEVATQLSSKWKEGKQESSAKQTEKEEKTQIEREETLQCKFEEDGKQHRLNKTLLTFGETGQRDDGSLTKQENDFGETKQEESESQRDLDTNKEKPRKDSEEQKKPLKMERDDQEYEMIDAGAQMKPGENEITELQKLHKEKTLQEQEWEESAWQMPQLEVREPEQQIRKEEEVARTAEIHKQHKAVEFRQKQEQLKKTTGLLECPNCKQEDETTKHKEHATQQEEEIQNALLQKTDQWRTGEYEQYMKKIEYLESRKRDLGTDMFENLKEELQKEHLEKQGLTRRIFEKDKQGNVTMEQSEHATQQKLLLKKVQFGIGEYTGYSEMPTGNLGLRPLLIDTTDLEQLKQKLRDEHSKNAEKVENAHKTIKQETKPVFLKIGKSVSKWLSSLFKDKDLKRKPVDPKFGKLPLL